MPKVSNRQAALKPQDLYVLLAVGFGFYNRRPHSALDGNTPDRAYSNQPLRIAAP